MTGRTCLKHGVPEWCPEGVCRWCPEPEPTFLGIPIGKLSADSAHPIIPVPTMTMWPLLPSPTACPHNKGWYDSNATYTYSCNACGKVWPGGTGPRYPVRRQATCPHLQAITSSGTISCAACGAVLGYTFPNKHLQHCRLILGQSSACTCGATP